MSDKVKCLALVSSIGTPSLKKGGIYYFDIEDAANYQKRGFLKILEVPEPEKAISKKRPSTRTRRKSK